MSRIIAACVLLAAPLGSAFHAPSAAALRAPLRTAAQPSRVAMGDVIVDLGEGYGTIKASFQPIFESGSDFIVARYPVPFELNVAPQPDGKVVVTKDDDQLKEGDIVRATSTFSMRMDTSFGLMPSAKKTKALFDVTGKQWEQVVEAFVANRKSVTNDVVLIVERKLS
ncbi:hypothetical protein T492DRAFT_1096833 [Pavlovales sp. CCMP2436]|nr:hypothetical protein T492DRAFT_1096833 [Pavlovales sp. CCMP2436]|mmetsp:Transcript_16932/g.43323  ORF Transcript_16932/g.43323 Transcript_16932/m.43323 type:complete len:168 (-) Transcript_16932:186-689(-)